MSLRPRDNCERSRRPSGASGGASGLDNRGSLAGEAGFGGGTDFAAAGVSTGDGSAWTFTARCFLRSGLICFATLSHSARSSSLSGRLRRGGAGNSGIEVEGGRFI
jgi:hypothetical protein